MRSRRIPHGTRHQECRRGLIWACAAAYLLVLGWSHPVTARLIPLTSPFQLNTATAGDQTVPRIYSIDDGGFVAIWHHELVEGSSLIEAVRGRVFDSNGMPRGDEFDFQDLKPPSVAASRGDSLVIRDDVGVGTALGRFGFDGTRLELWSIADEVPAINTQLSLARGQEREVILSWDESPFATVAAQVFDASGLPRPQPRVVVALQGPPDNEGVANPRIAAAGDGAFVVAWWAEFSEALWTRHFDPEGQPRADRFAAAPPGSFSDGGFDLCMDRASGSSVIVWDEQARRFAPAGESHDPICTGIGHTSLACAGEDRFVVAENRYSYAAPTSPVFGSERLLVVRAFSADDRVLGTTLIPAPVPRIVTLTSFPYVASIGPETIAATWQDCSAPCDQSSGCAIGCEVYAQLFRVTEQADCAGDCNDDGTVSIDELVTAVDLAVEGTDEAQADPTRCPALEKQVDCRTTIDEILGAVRAGLEGCPPS